MGRELVSSARRAKQYFLMRSPGIIKTQLVCAWRSRLDKSTARCALPSASQFLPPPPWNPAAALFPAGWYTRQQHAPVPVMKLFPFDLAVRPTQRRRGHSACVQRRVASPLRIGETRCELAERVGEARASARLKIHRNLFPASVTRPRVER